MELAGLPESTNGKDLEDLVVEDFEVAGVKVKKRDNHAIHRLANKKIVIVKLVNRRDAVNLHRNKKKSYENLISTTKITSHQQKCMRMNLFTHTITNCLENVTGY